MTMPRIEDLKRPMFFVLFLWMAGVVWSDVIEDFNDAVLSDGFYVTTWGGTAEPNGDNQTWKFTADREEWKYAGVISPRFTGQSFTAKFSCRDFVNAFEAYESVNAIIKGRNFEISFSFGLNDALTFILDSGYNIHGGYGVNSGPLLLAELNEYPSSLEMEIEYNGPGQPVNFYYTLDGGIRIHADTLSLDALAELTGDYDYTVEFRGGALGPFGARMDSVEITGVEPVVPAGKIVHELSREVSKVQGQNHWYYRMGDPYGSAARDLVWSDTAYGNWVKSYWYDAEGDAGMTNWADIIDVDTIGGPWLTTQNDTSPRLEWESPYEGSPSAVAIGTFKFESTGSVIGIVLHNGEVIWESEPLTADGEVEGFQVDIPALNKEDILTFTADGSQWNWVQFVHTRIELSGQTTLSDWPIYR